MLVRGYYMIGVPGEASDQFRQGVEKLCSLPVDEIRFAYFTPFPGTGAYQEYSKYCITDDLSMFTSAEPILELPTFKVSEQLAARRFLSGVRSHLKSHGRIFLAQGNYGALRKMHSLADQNNLVVRKLGQKTYSRDSSLRFYAFEVIPEDQS